MSRHDHKSSDLLELPGHANSLPPKRPGLSGGSADGLLTSLNFIVFCMMCLDLIALGC